ncbi:hypothetical protein EDD86DRAFT_206571 [Gorgonomyces haynaldii]|nr:hypothetical protein EDD86DRAFT_206571 [Gorgonomyces haynaldii]
MGIPHSLKIWKLGQAVAKGEPLASPMSWGPIPRHLYPHRNIIPVLMHGKRITFGDSISEKGKNRTRRAFFPNVMFKQLYSRALQMNVWTCLSAQALRKVDQFGGFDEYFIKAAPELITDRMALVYKKKILKEYENPASKVNQERKDLEKALEDRYGKDYVSSLPRLPIGVE